MSDPPHLVVIASVEWRARNLVKLLDCVAQQTRAPERIVVLLDGYGDATRRWVHQAIDALKLPITTVSSAARRGPGQRWIYATTMLWPPMDAATILSTIDDDFLIHPGYLRASYERVAAATEPMAIGWLGETPVFIPWTARLAEDVECISIGAGLLTCRLGDLDGIAKFPEVDRYFKPPGDDEALVSYWLWKNGVKLIRPKGVAEAVSVDALQHDPRASFIGQGKYRHGTLRMNLKEKHGWTTYELPSELDDTPQFTDGGVWVNPHASRPRSPG
jgi:hypothetical protein